MPCLAQNRQERARDLGIPLDGTPGALNAITDVPGVEVGHATLIRGSGKLRVGVGPIRTGVTAVFPRGTRDLSHVFAGWFSLNGNGEMTGTAWLDDYALLLYPITITNTNSVGVVRDAVIEWGRTRIPGVFNCCLPVVTETWDGDLNDIYGFHVGKAHVLPGIRRREGGTRTRRERRWRYRDAVSWLQGRNRNGQPSNVDWRRESLHSGCWCNATSA